MAQQIINIGTNPNSGDGDAHRVCFDKTNQNFTELYNNKAESSELSGLSDSLLPYRVSGCIYHQPASAVSVTIAVAGTFVGIGAVGDFTATGLAGFSIQNDGANRVLQYDGLEPLTGVTVGASLSVKPNAGQKKIEARIAKNGSVSTSAAAFSDSTVEVQLTIVDSFNLVTGDRLKIMVTNLDDTVSVLCKRLTLKV